MVILFALIFVACLFSYVLQLDAVTKAFDDDIYQTKLDFMLDLIPLRHVPAQTLGPRMWVKEKIGKFRRLK